VARIRTIKPEFPQSESVGKLSRDARLLFIQLWTLCDDSGRLRGNSRMLASLLYPYDEDAGTLLPHWLDELLDAGTVRRYSVEGETFIDIPKWLTHQKIDKPTPSKIPPFSIEFAKRREDSRKNAADLDLDLDLDLEGIKDNRTPRETPPQTNTPLKTLLDLGVEERAAKDWLKVRKAKRAPLTETAVDDLQREAGKAGIPVAQAVLICARKNWQGFNASWDWRSDVQIPAGERKVAL